MFVDKLVNVRQYVPLPTEESIVQESGWLPSRVFPSDHLAVVVDLEWSEETKKEGGEQ